MNRLMDLYGQGYQPSDGEVLDTRAVTNRLARNQAYEDSVSGSVNRLLEAAHQNTPRMPTYTPRLPGMAMGNAGHVANFLMDAAYEGAKTANRWLGASVFPERVQTGDVLAPLGAGAMVSPNALMRSGARQGAQIAEPQALPAPLGPEARNRADGYNLLAYHGTDAPEHFSSFSIAEARNPRERASFFTTNPEVASMYAAGKNQDYEKGRVMPVLLKDDQIHDFDMYSGKVFGDPMQLAQMQAREQGKSIIRFLRGPDQDKAIYAVLNPESVRNRYTHPDILADQSRASVPGTVLNSLPMDEASRMARAREMGFTGTARRTALPEEVWGPRFQKLMSQQYRIAEAGDDYSTMYDILRAKYHNSPGDSPELKQAIAGKLGELEGLLGKEWLNKYSDGGLFADQSRASVPGTVVNAAASEPQGIRAYHGSPHDFDRFDSSKIGTGEAYQSEGHGLYFAENEAVARSYRDKLKSRKSLAPSFAQTALDISGGNREKAIAYARSRANSDVGDNRQADWRDALHYLENGSTDPSLQGRMYEVRINARPEQFHEINADDAAARASVVGPEAANRLRDQGYAGVRYLDRGSRQAGEGTYNYVVFDDSLIEILRKYGLVPGAAVGGSALMGAQDAEAGQ